MKKIRKLINIISLAAIVIVMAQPALARVQHTGDKMIDDGWVPYNRPPVPSDREVGPDWFNPAVTFTYNPNFDMFDGMRKPNYDFGSEDMLATHPRKVPHYPLFDE